MAWINAAIPVLAAFTVLVLALRPLSDRALDAWAARFGVALSEDVFRNTARKHLRWEGRLLGYSHRGFTLRVRLFRVHLWDEAYRHPGCP